MGPTVASAAVLAAIAAVGYAPAVPVRTALGMAAVTTGFAALAVASSGPVGALALVAAACVTYGATNLRHEGGLLVLPLLVDLLAVETIDHTAAAVAAVVGGTALTVLVLVHVLGLHVQAKPVPPHLALPHTVLVTVLVTGASALWAAEALPHAYWLPLTILVVLRAWPDLGRRRVPARMAGTVVGAASAALGLLVLPHAVLVVAAFPLAVLMVAYTVTGDYLRFVVCLTPFVVFTASTGAVDADLLVTAERLGLTLVGVMLSAPALALLAGIEGRHRTAG
ncbi:MAG: FUSC family protein [Acidimicrobiia bacterium]|nr:FUSC family protein [Acidimicrobiia bacterium]